MIKINHYNYIVVVLVIGIFWSCEPPVVFLEPQPKDVNVLKWIPKHFQGTYWCDNDSVSLYVDKNLIYKSKMFDVTLTQQEINDAEEVRLENGQLFLKGINESFPTIKKNEIIFSTINLKDTIYASQLPENVVKLFKGHLVLNNKIRDKHWEVKIISLNPEGSLSVFKVNYPENLTELKAITKVKILESRDREQILISPTKAEFDQILDKKLIFTGNCQEFKPVVSSTQIMQ